MGRFHSPLVANSGAGREYIEIEPIRRLFRAVLNGALDELRAGVGRHPKSLRGRRAAAARRWLFDQDYRAPISFADVCSAFGLDPNQARAKLKAKFDAES